MNRTKHHRRLIAGLVAAFLVAGLLQVTNTNPAVSQTLSVTAYEAPDELDLDPGAEVWAKADGVNVPLSAQTGAYVAGGTVQTVRVRALHHRGRLFIRVAWPDGTDDSATTRVEDFSDAVAVEFPSNGSGSVPSLCMGQADAAVNIWQWRADSNAGLKDTLDVYSNSQVDGYPSTDKLFYTAREAGNPFANPELGAVQSLYSRAFGELAALDFQDATGLGKHTSDGWAVVFSRDFNTGHPGHAVFAPGTAMDMAVAVWDGNHDERNGKKAVSQFITLRIAAAPAYDAEGGHVGVIVASAGLLMGMAALGVGLAAYGSREGRH